MTEADLRPAAGDHEFLTLADIVRMMWRHRWKILVVTLLAGVVAAAVALSKPAGFESSTMLQVVPEYARDGRVDRDQFETSVLSHLELVQSPVIASSVLRQLDPPEELARLLDRVKITRPPKTSLIRLAARARTADRALATCRLWVKEVLAAVDQKNLEKAQIFVRTRMKDLQDDWIKYTAAAADVRARAERLQGERLVTVARSVDDTVLWRDLTVGVSPADASRMTNLFLKSQEINDEYLDIQRQLSLAEQQSAGARAARGFYQAALGILEARLESRPDKAEGVTTDSFEEARQYVDALVKARDILPMGDPIVYPAKRGATKTIGLAVFGAFIASCFLAFLVEWFKQAHIRD